MLTCVSPHPSAAPHGKCGHMPGPPEQDSYKVIKKKIASFSCLQEILFSSYVKLKLLPGCLRFTSLMSSLHPDCISLCPGFHTKLTAWLRPLVHVAPSLANSCYSEKAEQVVRKDSEAKRHTPVKEAITQEYLHKRWVHLTELQGIVKNWCSCHIVEASPQCYYSAAGFVWGTFVCFVSSHE